MAVVVSIEATFIAAARELPPDRRKAAQGAVEKFGREPRLPSLKFRVLEGRDNYFIINARRGDRIILHKDGDDL